MAARVALAKARRAISATASGFAIIGSFRLLSRFLGCPTVVTSPRSTALIASIVSLLGTIGATGARSFSFPIVRFHGRNHHLAHKSAGVLYGEGWTAPPRIILLAPVHRPASI